MVKTQPSRTAYKVALNIITLGTIPGMEQILPPGIIGVTETLLIKSGTIGEKTAAFARSKWAVRMYRAFDWMLPGQFEAFAHRKAFCENQVRDGIRKGATQILVLGGGYDTLCWRLAPFFPEVGFFEIDHPDTGYFKAKGIEKMGRPGNLNLIAQDLGRSKLSDVLRQKPGWDTFAKTVFIAEGLVMYLQGRAVRDLFDQCAAISGEGSRIAFSYIPMGRDGRPDAGRWTGLMLRLQKLGKEPWVWSITPEGLKAFLESCGWEQIFDNDTAGQKYGIEYYAVAAK